MVAGRGYFVNNTSAAGIVKLPTSASAGDTIAIKDYAANFATNKLTIQRNGHKIQGAANDGEIKTNRASVQLVYIDATKGWLYTNESNVADLGKESFISATGGTITTSGNDKIHTFTGDGNFVIASAGGNPANNNKVGYLVVAGGGGGGGRYHGAGGGAGGFREGRCSSVTPYTDSPLSAAGLPVSAQTYPISVGGGGAGGGNDTPGTVGSNSIFSTITSAGGGGGGNYATGPGGNGGSGGGASTTGGSATAGSGNTPPVSPPQGFNGGTAPSHASPNFGAGGGGGAGGAGGNGSNPQGGPGADGLVTHTTGSPVRYAGGGGGSAYVNNPASGQGGQGGGGAGSATSNGGTGGTNKGGGGGGVGDTGGTGGAGGKGIVVIRYKFQ